MDVNNKTIALIIPDFDFGGEEKRVLFFANGYVKFFKKVILISPEGKSIEFLDKRIVHISLKVRDLSNLSKVLNVIKENGVDFLQGHKRATLPYLFFAEKILKIKSTFNFDNIYPKHNYLFSLISPRNILYLSDILKEFYSRFYKNYNNTTINMGGDFFERKPTSVVDKLKEEIGIENESIILNLGRLSDQKNQKQLIRAVSQLKDINFVCLIVGSGPLEESLKKLTDDLGLNARVKFLGHRTDVASLLSLADVLVQCSNFEGFPNVFIEAASVGVPIISTNVGSSSTLVKSNGILIDQNDDKILTDAIVEVLTNGNFKKEAQLFSESDYLKQFHKDEMLLNYVSYYKS